MKKKTSKSDVQVVISKERGVNAKGFGHIAKQILVDPSLPITAKGIYGYLSSMAGSGENTFTSRSRILFDIKINGETYDKNLKFLEDKSYVKRYQNRRSDGSFSSSVIEFIMIPAHLEQTILENQQTETKPTLYSGTIYALGWGTVPRLVMQDPRINIKEKALYCYFCAYAGPGSEAFPTRKKILYELSLNKDTYSKYLKSLTSLNYITAIQYNQNGKMTRNYFRINQFPDEEKAPKAKIVTIPNTRNDEANCLENPGTVNGEAPCPKNPGTVNGEAPCPKNPGTVNGEAPCPKNPCTVNPCTVNPCPVNPCTATYITNNNLTNNSFTINNILYDRLINLVQSKISYKILELIYEETPAAMIAINQLVNSMVQVLATNAPRVLVNGEPHITESVRDTLLQVDNTAVVNVIERYLVWKDHIKEGNEESYLLTSIYNEIMGPSGNDDANEAP